MDQWKTAEAVTIATAAGEIHFQKMTGSVSWCDFIFDFISMLKICRWLPDLRAITLDTGFMIADSAVIGRRCGSVGVTMSMITTWT